MVVEEASEMQLARSWEGTAGMQPRGSHSLSLSFSHGVLQLHAQAVSEAGFFTMHFGLARFSYS